MMNNTRLELADKQREEKAAMALVTFRNYSQPRT